MFMRLGLVLAAGLLLSGCEIGDFGPSDRYQKDFHYTYDVEPDARINLESFNGSIEIAGWDRNKVEIAGTQYGSTEELRDAVKIDIHNAPGSIDVRTVRPSAHWGSMGARFTLHVPNKAVLDRIITSNAAIRVGDVAAATHLKTSNGSIRASNVNGDVDAHTSNSSIELESIGGSVTVRTSNGRIHAENVAGACDAETSNGGITVRLENAPAAPVKLTSSNGPLDLTLTKAPKGDIRMKTSNGGITLRIPANSGARLIADTSNSSIHSDFDVAVSGNKHIDGAIGGGGPAIDLSTRNGSIRIARESADSVR